MGRFGINMHALSPEVHTMRHHVFVGLITLCAALAAGVAQAAVHVAVQNPKVTTVEGAQRIEQSATISTEVGQYTLTYDINKPDEGEKITGHYWAWQGGWITLGMTEPSQTNWYWQGFIKWTFDDLSLHEYPAQMKVVRGGGQDGMVSYTWDTPTVKATLRFAMTAGSDKLLVFADYEPKQEIKSCEFSLGCYPASFAEPRNRSVTTVLGTRNEGSVSIDLAKERWMLLEDTTPNRPGSGSAGLIIGTPDAFEQVSTNASGYLISPRFRLKPEARRFAIALYDYPALPDYTQTREYFGKFADAEAAALQQLAAGDLDSSLAAMPASAERFADLLERGAEIFARQFERWAPNPEAPTVPWARSIPGEPIKAAVYCPRYCAWENMELARRLEMEVEHIYFDSKTDLANSRNWPYFSTTGYGPLPLGLAAHKAAAMSTDPDIDLFISGGVNASAIPPVAMQGIVEQVARGKALLIAGKAEANGWPKELFADEDTAVTEDLLADFDWEQLPGLRPGDAGRIGSERPIRLYRYEQGTVAVVNVKLNSYGGFMPDVMLRDGLDGTFDRVLGLTARAALAAVGRAPANDLKLTIGDGAAPSLDIKVLPETPAAGKLIIQVQDDLDRVLHSAEVAPDRLAGPLELPSLPAGRQCFIDSVLLNPNGEMLAMTSRAIPMSTEPSLGDIAVEPSVLSHELAVPEVELPDGGQVTCSAALGATPAGATMRWAVSDIHGRVIAQQETNAPANGRAAAILNLSRPVTPLHMLDVSLYAGDACIAYERSYFTIACPYPYDDFTCLLWSYSRCNPTLTQTDRAIYEYGTDMCDLSHVGGFDDQRAADQYLVTSKSGLRLVPYVTRLAGEANASNERVPCLHKPATMEGMGRSMTVNARQAAPYSPPAYTLGDENYLFRGQGEVCHSPESVAAFKQWLIDKYGDVSTLNQTWASNYPSFDAIGAPMLIAEAATQTASFAPWIDHKLFMDDTFAGAHRDLAEMIRVEDAGAKVGWDGLLGYNWRSGYDFTKLTEGLDMNQTYSSHYLQGRLYRSFKSPNALTGKWGNSIADVEAGWHAHPWDCLFSGDNSVWWWTSYGLDYTPFCPDLSETDYSKWFFEAVNEVRAGPGKLLLHAERDGGPVAVLYAQRDLFAAAIAAQNIEAGLLASDSNHLKQHEQFLHAVEDFGTQAHHLSVADLAAGDFTPADTRVLILPLASCLSDEEVSVLREYVQSGGTLLVDARAGLLTGDGRIREARPLDELLGVTSQAGVGAVMTAGVNGEGLVKGTIPGVAAAVDLDLAGLSLEVIEPGLATTTGTALGSVGETPILIVNRVGDGVAVTLNFSILGVGAERTSTAAGPLEQIIGAVLTSAGVSPYCQLTRTDGSAPRVIEQALFTDGQNRYLALQHDFLTRVPAEGQDVHISLPEPALVYDVRAGKRIGDGAVAEWDAHIARGEPLVYAMLPSAMEAVQARVAERAARGESVEVQVRVRAGEQRPGYHVVRMDVYAPGSDRPHREYSQNIGCTGGTGDATIPLALNDQAGEWRLSFRDVASGVQTQTALSVQ